MNPLFGSANEYFNKHVVNFPFETYKGWYEFPRFKVPSDVLTKLLKS